MVSKLPKFTKYAAALSKGTLTLEDVRRDKLAPEDVRKMRLETPQMFGVSRSPKYDLGALEGERRRRYLFVSEAPIGHFHDVPLADAWSLREFDQRRSPILFGHNHDMDRPPIGRAFDVKTNQVIDGIASMTGTVEFDTEDDFGGMVFGAIDRGFLNGFSVGFDILEGRAPTEDEVKRFGLNEFATIFTKTSLTEGSIVPVGRDPRAGVMAFSGSMDDLEAWLASEQGSADDKRRFRMTLLGAKSDRTVITKGFGAGIPEESEEPSKEAEQANEEPKEYTKEELLDLASKAYGVSDEDLSKVKEFVKDRSTENLQRPATYGELVERDEEARQDRENTRALEAQVESLSARLKSIEAYFTGLEDGGAAPEGDGAATPDELSLESQFAAYLGE